MEGEVGALGRGGGARRGGGLHPRRRDRRHGAASRPGARPGRSFAPP
ncbi:hypothetical protein AB5I41_04545 [Sphingomonas sp. MMS24-JH45]